VALSEERALLETGLPSLSRRVDARLIDALEQGYRGERASVPEETGLPPPQRLVAYLVRTVERESETIERLQEAHLEFSRRHDAAVTAEERATHVLDLARALGATRRQLAGDRRALGRWFGRDAVVDRFRRRLGAHERRLAFTLERTGALTALALGGGESPGGPVAYLRGTRLEKTVKPLLAYQGDARVRTAAFRCLAAAIRALPREARAGALAEDAVQATYRTALDGRDDVWTQCEALSLLQELSPDSLRAALSRRIARPLGNDDLFVRHRAVRLLARGLDDAPALAALLPVAARDPSPFVRQSLCEALARARPEHGRETLTGLARRDPVPQVRATALLALGRLAPGDREAAETALTTLVAVLEEEQDAFTLRVALRVTLKVHAELASVGDRDAATQWRTRLSPALESLHRGAASLTARRWAAQTREHLWCDAEPRARALRVALAPVSAGLPPGRPRSLPRRLLRDVPEDTLGRVLSLLAEEDFGLDLEWRWPLAPRVTRGHVFRFRAWRWLLELRRPATDKRQAFRHTVGRVFRGRLRVPSARLAELAETKVPGEPLHLASEAGWRPYLPLVDEAISCLDQGFPGRAVQFYTAEGVTELSPPRTFAARLRARTALTVRFPAFARLRNWVEDGPGLPSGYVEALRALGFRIDFRPHPSTRELPWSADPAVQRFFPLLGLGETEQWRRLQDYFFSVYQNTLGELAIFLAVMATLFFGRHLHLARSVRRARRRIPLVIGGWGTRGKSGTERLKAALMDGLGYGVVSKTTGCEAMLVHGNPFGRLREMALFRPYDKATIWEQANVVRLASRLGADVLLWECMALTPAYVRVLQHQWMNDDLTTLTNAYPDHEDLQGPAGVNIPEVMVNFIPRRATLLTSEEQMLPILRHAASGLGTELRSVGWLEAGLLAPDALARFPYDEHPYNVALVLALARELGIDEAFALREMADRVVPDLGVLKAFPPAPLRTRTLEFVNGMSANERFGFLSNWQRMGFADQDPDREPGVWITTVINNRADRVARSRVFAGIVASEASADRHFLIGTNLRGLLGFVRESWDAYAADLTLWPLATPAGAPAPEAVLERLTRRLRVPVREAQVAARLRAMLHGVGHAVDDDLMAELIGDPGSTAGRLAALGLATHAPAIAAHLTRDLAEQRSFAAFRAGLGDLPPEGRPAKDREMRALLWSWLEARLVVVEDPHASGDAIIDRICEETPPGIHNRIMGSQNIKGTGLDFAYRWQAWDACHRACTEVRSPDPAVAARGLRQLTDFQDYGVVCAEYVRETLERARRSPAAQSELFQAQLTLVESSLAAALARYRQGIGEHAAGGLLARAVGWVEAFLDAGDAVRRRKRANRIYADLAAERISHDRAVRELQALNQRQKGGWLLRQLGAAARALARAREPSAPPER
jgi:poly-gamma-glutamate synthase PgsB/CapB